MTKPVNTKAIEEATGISWSGWLHNLDAVNARGLLHREIADKAYEKLEGLGLDINNGWWSQSIAVAYEQHIGRRQPGQRSDGTFEITVSKTLGGSITDAFDLWQKVAQNHNEFGSVNINSQPTITGSGKRRHWAVNLADGSRVNSDVDDYGGKTRIAITHTKLKDVQAQERWRLFWKELLQSL